MCSVYGCCILCYIACMSNVMKDVTFAVSLFNGKF